MTSSKRLAEMTKYFTYKALLLTCLYSAPVGGQTLHAVIVADTNDATIGRPGDPVDYVEVSKTQIADLSEWISSIINYKLSRTVLTGDDVNFNKVSSVVDGINPSDNDIVLFYYAGHGFHPERMPDMHFPALYINGGNLPVENIVSSIKNKKPRFMLVLTDACNNPADLRLGGQPPAAAAFADMKSGVLKLFKNTSGYVVGTGSTVPQFSWISSARGGMFTDQFQAALRDEILNSNPSWSHLIEKASKTIEFKNGEENIKQNPYFEYKVN